MSKAMTEQGLDLLFRLFFTPGDDRQHAFAGMQIKSNFLCNLGYGDPAKLFPRNPRLDFEEACSLL